MPPKNESLLSPQCIDQFIEAQKYELIGRLIDGMAHNIQSPLTAIKGYAQLLLEDHPDLAELSLIIEESGLIQELAHNLLIKSRWLQDRSIKAVNLNSIINIEVEFLNAHMIFKHKIQKKLSLDPELPMLKGVHADFSQIILNVLMNSTDAVNASENKTITICTHFDDGSVFLDVSDTGPGFDENSKIQCFDWFYTTKKRLSDPTDDKNPVGTGRGLSGTRRMVNKYHGDIRFIESKSCTLCRIQFPIPPRPE